MTFLSSDINIPVIVVSNCVSIVSSGIRSNQFVCHIKIVYRAHPVTSICNELHYCITAIHFHTTADMLILINAWSIRYIC